MKHGSEIKAYRKVYALAYNATACGNNCAKWNLEIAQNKDLTISLHHSMNFGDGEYAIKISNNGVVVHNQEEWLDVVYDFL